MNGHARPCNSKPQRRDLTSVLRRPVEAAPKADIRLWSQIVRYVPIATNAPQQTAIIFMALTCRWRSRPQHHKRTLWTGKADTDRDAHHCIVFGFKYDLPALRNDNPPVRPITGITPKNVRRRIFDLSSATGVIIP